MNPPLHDYKVPVLDISNWGLTTALTSTSSMFWCCRTLEVLDVSVIPMDNVTNAENMLCGLDNVGVLDVSGWNMSNCENAGALFCSCQSVSVLDVSNWNTSKMTDMNSMFSACYSLEALDVTSFDTSLVTNMYAMFSGLKSLTSPLDVTGFNTALVEDMSNMFEEYPFATLDLSSFNTSKVKWMDRMFGGSKLEVLDLGHFATDSNPTYMYLFANCENLVKLNIAQFKPFDPQWTTWESYWRPAVFGVFEEYPDACYQPITTDIDIYTNDTLMAWLIEKAQYNKLHSCLLDPDSPHWLTSWP